MADQGVSPAHGAVGRTRPVIGGALRGISVRGPDIPWFCGRCPARCPPRWERGDEGRAPSRNPRDDAADLAGDRAGAMPRERAGSRGARQPRRGRVRRRRGWGPGGRVRKPRIAPISPCDSAWHETCSALPPISAGGVGLAISFAHSVGNGSHRGPYGFGGVPGGCRHAGDKRAGRLTNPSSGRSERPAVCYDGRHDFRGGFVGIAERLGRSATPPMKSIKKSIKKKGR